MLHFFAVVLWIAEAASQAQAQQTPWEKLLNRAIQLQDAGRYDEADAAYRAALDLEQLPPDHLSVGRILAQLGTIRALQHDYPAARSAFERSLRYFGETTRAGPPRSRTYPGRHGDA